MGTVLPLFKEVQNEWQTFSDSIGKWVQPGLGVAVGLRRERA